VFFGKVEGVNDLITFEGRSVDELENAFQFMVDEHIKDCATENLDVEIRNTQSVNSIAIGT
jgi:predicted HicB family RNase H-like nuclease